MSDASDIDGPLNSRVQLTTFPPSLAALRYRAWRSNTSAEVDLACEQLIAQESAQADEKTDA